MADRADPIGPVQTGGFPLQPLPVGKSDLIQLAKNRKRSYHKCVRTSREIGMRDGKRIKLWRVGSSSFFSVTDTIIQEKSLWMQEKNMPFFTVCCRGYDIYLKILICGDCAVGGWFKMRSYIRGILTALSIMLFITISLSIQSAVIHGELFLFSRDFSVREIYPSQETKAVHLSSTEINNMPDELAAQNIPLSFEQYSSVVKQELSRYIINIKFSKSEEDWEVIQTGDILTIYTKVVNDDLTLSDVKVIILYKDNRRYYEPIHIEYGGEVLFDDEI